MFKKATLSFIVMLILMVSMIFAGTYVTNVRPDRIITNSINGDAETIQVCVSISVVNVEDLIASITVNGGEKIFSNGYYYCAIDDILHIYFNKNEVIEYLIGAEIEGEAVVDLTGSFQSGDKIIDIEGSDVIEVINPTKKITK